MIYYAHPLTFALIILCVLIAPLYVFATFVFSGCSHKKGMILAILWMCYGVVMSIACLFRVSDKIGVFGSLIVPISWVLPSLLLYFARNWVFSEKFSDRILVGLQLLRAVGGVFLIEMSRGYLPGIFAYPAGIGDLIVAVMTLFVLIRYRALRQIPKNVIYVVIIVGVIDFIGALFFGFTSSDSPFQLFAHGFDSKLIVYPTGMIPFFLVPYAIFYHVLSWINLSRHPMGDQLPENHKSVVVD